MHHFTQKVKGSGTTFGIDFAFGRDLAPKNDHVTLIPKTVTSSTCSSCALQPSKASFKSCFCSSSGLSEARKLTK